MMDKREEEVSVLCAAPDGSPDDARYEVYKIGV